MNRPYNQQHYPGQPYPNSPQTPYPASPQPGGQSAPSPAPYSGTPHLPSHSPHPPVPARAPAGTPQPPQQQSYQQAPYGQQPQYNQNQPPYGQQYGAPPQQPQYGQQSYQQQQPYPAQYPYPQNQPPYGQQQPGQQQPGQYPPQGYPPQGQGAPQYGAPQYGAPPPQPAGPHLIASYKQALNACIQEKQLQSMYPPNSPIIDQIVSRVTGQIDQLCTAWRVPREVGQDIIKLALFDVILYIDDSGSMQFEENGERVQDLKLILSRVAYATSLFDTDGIQVRFMNNDQVGDNIRSEAQVDGLIKSIQFKGLTPLGTSLKNKVLEPLVLAPARAGQLRKPVLVITITDGQPAGENPGTIDDVIRSATSELQRNPRYGKGALSFQFAQVGNDLKAREFLSKLDEAPGIGELIDCTSNFEVEQDEMSRANPPVDLTPELWLTKMMLGAIDSSYDTKDEKTNRPAGGPPSGQYGAPPPGQYGAPPPGQYGGGYPASQPPQQGGHPGYAPQGYGQQQQPPPQPPYGQQPPPPGQYGRPPQGSPGGYPPQQQGYGGAPPRY
ncbi:hypothetical protein AJ80_03091 [Polytolypa hystricis UAMH7299]|uniref:VWFA domain-containing protein n=1 Tax=Polytolypa hystricis (strain UAMH7299) TaxID=1447883 RepID=A0A2B7YLC7_POLH7|nr:hypothetical protein AJ80_03091 [Polytolypa hystricis UAMH7299]